MKERIVAIDRLKLNVAFSEGTHTAFDNCWTVRMDSNLLVIDDDESKYTHFSDDFEHDGRKALLIINAENRQIVLLSIDNKLFASLPGGIADAALFDEEQFHFMEFKTNAYGNSDEAVRQNFDKATSQLKATLNLFCDRTKKAGIDFKQSVALTCHVITLESYPKSKATKQEYRVAFLEDTGIELCFDRKLYWNGIEE